MKKILVAYYSRTGHTSDIAKQIALACDAELESIKDIRRHRHAFGYLRMVFEAAFHLETTNQRVQNQPDEFDIVVIGTPIWCWNMASPVRAYVKRFRSRFKRVAFFCTCGGSGQAKVIRDLEKLAGQTALASLALAEPELRSEIADQKIAAFIASLNGVETMPEAILQPSSRAEMRFDQSNQGLLDHLP